MPPFHLERTAQWRLLCARERTRNTAKPSSRLDAVILELVGHLDEVAVRILEVNGQDFTHRSGPLARPVDNFYALAPDLQDDRIQRVVILCFCGTKCEPAPKVCAISICVHGSSALNSDFSCQRILTRLSSHQASSTEAIRSATAYSVPPGPSAKGRLAVFMPKKPVTSVGGSRKAVMIERM